MLIGRLVWVNCQEISNCCRPVLTYWLTDWCLSDWPTADHVRHFAATAFLCCGLRQFCTVGHGIFYMANVNDFLLVNWIMLILQTFILKQCLSGYVLHNSLLYLLLKNGDFLNTDISQGSVATRLGCGGVFIYHFVTNFLLSLTVKEFAGLTDFYYCITSTLQCFQQVWHFHCCVMWATFRACT